MSIEDRLNYIKDYPNSDDIKFLIGISKILIESEREGSLIDKPEGLRYIRFSDTFATKVGESLKEIAIKMENFIEKITNLL